MVGYKLYVRDQEGEEHLIAIIPERRQNRKRITEESLINLCSIILGDDTQVDLGSIRFVKVKDYEYVGSEQKGKEL